MPKKRSAMKGISRIDSGSTHGWFVRSYRAGRTYSKLFSDRKYGGKNKALQLAKSHRDELAEELEALPKKRSAKSSAAADARYAAGPTGIARVTSFDPEGEGQDFEGFEAAYYPKPGVFESVSFSIKEFGEAKALDLATQVNQANA